MCNNGPVSWRSTKTPLIALNVSESEIIALSSASQEKVFLRKLCNELGFLQPHPTIIYEDCESAVALSRENRFKKRSKYMDVRWSFVVEKQRHGDLRVVSVSRTIMLADILCNPRAASSFIPFRNTIMGIPPVDHTPDQLSRVAPAAASNRIAPAPPAGLAPTDGTDAHSGSLPAKGLSGVPRTSTARLAVSPPVFLAHELNS